MRCATCLTDAACVRGNKAQLICLDCDLREHMDFELVLRLERSLTQLVGTTHEQQVRDRLNALISDLG